MLSYCNFMKFRETLEEILINLETISSFVYLKLFWLGKYPINTHFLFTYLPARRYMYRTISIVKVQPNLIIIDTQITV